ncbi:Transcription initiation factor TFIID subunit 4 [Halotydeus destructor]|nr:Transcription initiation factor TFIID subunit 4 [Halotydeus destructor]
MASASTATNATANATTSVRTSNDLTASSNLNESSISGVLGSSDVQLIVQGSNNSSIQGVQLPNSNHVNSAVNSPSQPQLSHLGASLTNSNLNHTSSATSAPSSASPFDKSTNSSNLTNNNGSNSASRRVTLVPAQPQTPLLSKAVIINQQQQANHTNPALLQQTLNSSVPSVTSQFTGALPASGYITPTVSTHHTLNAMSGNLLQGNGTALKPAPGLPNGSAPAQLATSLNHIGKATVQQNSIPVSLSAIPQIVIASSTPQAMTGSTVTTIASHNFKSNLNSALNKQTVLVSTAKDGSQSIVIQASTAGTPSHSTVLTSKANQHLTTQVSNPNLMPFVFNVPSRPGAPQAPGVHRNLTPRFVAITGNANSPIRIAPSQMMQRPGGPVQLQNVPRGTFLVKTETGQFQLVNVNPAGMAGATLPAGIRFQVPSSVGQHIRTSTPQHVTVSVPSSAGHNTMHRPALPGQPVNQPLTINTAAANSNSAATPSQMSPNTAKKKCKNFLSTLIRLASDQPEQVATNVKNLIQGLINGLIQPEDFTNNLQKELNSSPQPCLIPFLKKSLPYLRHSLMIGEMTIDGVQAPPQGSVQLPLAGHAIPQIQIAQGARPTAPGTTLRFITPVSTGIGLTTQSLNAAMLTRPATTVFTTPQAPVPQPAPAQPVPTKPPAAPKPKASKAKSPGAASKEKKASNVANNTTNNNFASLRDDDDINDVAAMGGVNLMEESQRMATSTEFVGTQIRSIKDETFLFTNTLQNRINTIAKKCCLDEVPQDVVSIVSHAAQEYLKNLVEKLGVIAEHRLEILRNDNRYEVVQDVRGQIKFLEELDKLEKKRHEEQEREMLLRAAKSRSKLEDPEQLKLKQKAKEMQRAEQEEVRQREANETALLAIGPRKKLKLSSPGTPMSSNSNSFSSNQPGSYSTSFGTSSNKPTIRRVKRVIMRDVHFLMEQEPDLSRSMTLYKAYAK